jgi:plasmid stability protein
MPKRATVYLEPELHTALKVKAAHTDRSMSELVNDAVRESLREDQEDLQAFADRAAEPVMTYEALLADLKAHGKI